MQLPADDAAMCAVHGLPFEAADLPNTLPHIRSTYDKVALTESRFTGQVLLEILVRISDGKPLIHVEDKCNGEYCNDVLSGVVKKYWVLTGAFLTKPNFRKLINSLFILPATEAAEEYHNSSRRKSKENDLKGGGGY